MSVTDRLLEISSSNIDRSEEAKKTPWMKTAKKVASVIGIGVGIICCVAAMVFAPVLGVAGVVPVGAVLMLYLVFVSVQIEDRLNLENNLRILSYEQRQQYASTLINLSLQNKLRGTILSATTIKTVLEEVNKEERAE